MVMKRDLAAGHERKREPERRTRTSVGRVDEQKEQEKVSTDSTDARPKEIIRDIIVVPQTNHVK